MAIYFGQHNLYTVFDASPGIGSISVSVPFVPDYIKVDFHDVEVSKRDGLLVPIGEDQIYWNLSMMSPTTYQLDIGWSVYTGRKIYYRLSQLTVDPV